MFLVPCLAQPAQPSPAQAIVIIWGMNQLVGACCDLSISPPLKEIIKNQNRNNVNVSKVVQLYSYPESTGVSTDN